MKRLKLVDVFLEKIWPMLLCCTPLLAIIVVLVRAETMSTPPDLNKYVRHFNTTYEMLQTIDGACELLLLDYDEYLDFDSELYYEPGKYEDNSSWKNLLIVYGSVGEDISEITLEVFFPAYNNAVPMPDKESVITMNVYEDVNYYLIDMWNEPDDTVSKVEAITFCRNKITYFLQTISAQNSEKNIWYYYELIC